MVARTTFLEKIPFCILAAGFIGKGLATMIKCYDCPPFSAYRQSLDEEQRRIFDTVRAERASRALQGLVLGLMVSTFVLYYTGASLNPLVSGCLYAGLALFIQYYYYTLIPKSTYMVQHLNTQEQLDLHSQVNRHMQLRAHLGTLMGYLGIAIIPYLLS